MDWANAIMELRSDLGLSQPAFAKLVGCSRRSVQHWEAGKSQPHELFAKRMAAMQRKLLSGKR
jgi:DNA-binding transcriptional regulator YiaG